MAIYFDIEGFMKVSGLSSAQAQIAAEEWLENPDKPQASQFVDGQHVNEWLHSEWERGFICLEDSYGVFHADPYGKVDEIAIAVFDTESVAEEEAEKMNNMEKEYNAGPSYNTSIRNHSWFVDKCDLRGIPLDQLCPYCMNDRRYHRCEP